MTFIYSCKKYREMVKAEMRAHCYLKMVNVVDLITSLAGGESYLVFPINVRSFLLK